MSHHPSLRYPTWIVINRNQIEDYHGTEESAALAGTLAHEVGHIMLDQSHSAVGDVEGALIRLVEHFITWIHETGKDPCIK